MPRFYIPYPHIENGLLKIEGDEVKHIRKVLRLKAGDGVIVFDGLGKEFEGKIFEEGRASVMVKIQRMLSPKRDSPLDVTLAQSLLKGEKMDYLIQKATELGVKEIIPFFSSRSIPLLEKSGSLKRHHRWRKITIEASKQCGRGVVPKIESIQTYSDMLHGASTDHLRLILWEGGGIKVKEVLEGSKEKKKIFFIIGPEGGFNQEEVEKAERAGFVAVTLGRRILRAETASICFLSILQYEWGDVG
jgi:16S rRNA (uracil1498-N3)-methyltransferase